MTDVKKIVAVVVSSMAFAALVPACGSGSGSCGKVAPCGGDVVGNYSIAAACINNSAFNMDIGIDCPGATARASGISASGSASFNADLTYTMTQTLAASVQMTLPPSCLTMNGITLTCAQLDQALQQLLVMQPGTFQSARCSGTSSCTCSFTLAPQTSTQSGTYTTAGTTITLSGSGTREYCVQNNELHFPEVDLTMPMGTIQADTVLVRQ